MMTKLLLAVALISLLVGGVGIMNIMLVSVTERTREIGLRMAVGAWSRDILQQFLAESVILCFCGGAVGILVGRGISILVRSFAALADGIFPGRHRRGLCGLRDGRHRVRLLSGLESLPLDPIIALRYE